MDTNDIFDKILISPMSEGCNELYVVSGFARASFVMKHLEQNPDLKINLIIGMPRRKNDHLGFLDIYNKFNGRFKGYYLMGTPEVHAKLYSWHKEGVSLKGFSSSANYTHRGFGQQQINQFTADSSEAIDDFFESLLYRCDEIKSSDFEGSDLQDFAMRKDEDLTGKSGIEGSVEPGSIYWNNKNRVTISFLDKRGRLPAVSGFNWGQRDKRNRNEAYLPLRAGNRNQADPRKNNFLPELTTPFTLVCDDGKVLDCKVVQGGRKGIETTYDNGLLGKYLRERMGLNDGEFVTLEHLINYGRTDFTIEAKSEDGDLDNTTYYLDFSVKK